jgi:hypothetical protein
MEGKMVKVRYTILFKSGIFEGLKITNFINTSFPEDFRVGRQFHGLFTEDTEEVIESEIIG